jgi:hypothetical protein
VTGRMVSLDRLYMFSLAATVPKGLVRPPVPIPDCQFPALLASFFLQGVTPQLCYSGQCEPASRERMLRPKF